jgi:hypothetical protein
MRHFGKLYNSLSAFRNDSLVSMQVAELSFDSFMMRMHTRIGPLRDVEPVRDVEKEKAPENSPGAFSIAYS